MTLDRPHEASDTARRSLPPMLVILAASLVFVVTLPITTFVLGVIAQSQQLDADARAVRSLLRHDLATGATLARTLAVLSSRDVARFLTTHHYDDPYPDLPFQHVRFYDPTRDASQTFPGGRVLKVVVTQDWDRGIRLYFSYDRRGRLTRWQVEAYVNPAIG